jgi:uncharacterized protein (UPF0332 family)
MSREEIMALVNYHLERAQTALEDGKFLLEGGRSPQSIINRAYYAMFYAALALLQKIGKVPSKHTGVISLFDTEFVVCEWKSNMGPVMAIHSKWTLPKFS